MSRKVTMLTRRGFLGAASTIPVMAALAACGTAATQPEMAADKPAEKAEAAPATPAEPVDVLFVPNGSFMFQEEGHVSGGLVAAFGEEFPNVNLIVEPYSGNRNEAFAAAAAANIPYDVVTGGEGTPIDRGLQGTVLHLNDYIKATGLDMGDVWEGLLEPVVWRDGRVFGMPYGPDMRVLYMNIDLYVSGGLDPATGPQTWDDFEEAIQKTTRRDAAGNLTVAGFPPDWGSNGTWLFMLPLLQLGGSRTNDDRTKMTFNTPEGVEAFTFVKRLWDLQDGYTAVKAFQESALPSGRARGAALVNAKCASIYMTYAERKQQIIPLEPDYEFGYTGFPLPTNPARQASLGGAWIHMVSAWTEVAEESFAWLEYLARPENTLAFTKTFDRVPVRKSATLSEEFHENDPFVLHMSDNMQYRTSTLGFGVPGSDQMRIEVLTRNWIGSLMNGEVGIQEGLATAEAQMNVIAEDWRKELGL